MIRRAAARRNSGRNIDDGFCACATSARIFGAATLGAVAGWAELATATRPAAAAEEAAGPTEFTSWLDSIGGKRQLYVAPVSGL